MMLEPLLNHFDSFLPFTDSGKQLLEGRVSQRHVKRRQFILQEGLPCRHYSFVVSGDSRLTPGHLTMPTPDVILFDFSDSEWHFTFEGAVKLANAYPNTLLLLCHWGSVDAPDFAPFNGDPAKLAKAIVNPERIGLLAPGEPFTLKRLKK